MKLTIRGIEYEAKPLSATKAAMLGVGMGLYDRETGTAVNLDTSSEVDLRNRMIAAFSNPFSKYQVACALKDLIPSIDPSLVDYRMFLLPDGRQEVEAVLELEVDEIIAVLRAYEQPKQQPDDMAAEIERLKAMVLQLQQEKSL